MVNQVYRLEINNSLSYWLEICIETSDCIYKRYLEIFKLVSNDGQTLVKLFKMIDVMFQWIFAWIALYWLIQGYMYILRMLN